MAARCRTKAAAGACRGRIRVRQGLGRRIRRCLARRGSLVMRRKAGARLPGRIHSIGGSWTERRHRGEGEKKGAKEGQCGDLGQSSPVPDNGGRAPLLLPPWDGVKKLDLGHGINQLKDATHVLVGSHSDIS